HISADSCHAVEGLIVDGVGGIAPADSFTFTNVTAAHTILVLSTLREYLFSVPAALGGTITPATAGQESVSCGTDQTFTVTPDSCHSIADVLVDGGSVGAVASYTFTNVQAAHTISATFAVNTYAFFASAGAGGTIAPDGGSN